MKASHPHPDKHGASWRTKTQCQALDRTQPSLPMKPGRAGTHDPRLQAPRHDRPVRGDERRHRRGTHPPAQGPRRQRTCWRSSSRSTPPCHGDWRCTSSWTTSPRTEHREIATWLAHKDRRRWHLHFTPTSSSWLNLIERWFKELTDKRLRRGMFTCVDDLTEAITILGRALEHRPQALRLESHRRRHHRKRSPEAAKPSTRSNQRQTTRPNCQGLPPASIHRPSTPGNRRLHTPTTPWIAMSPFRCRLLVWCGDASRRLLGGEISTVRDQRGRVRSGLPTTTELTVRSNPCPSHIRRAGLRRLLRRCRR